MTSIILGNIPKATQAIVPQNTTQFIALQMALKAGDPFLFRPYLRFIETHSLGHAVAVFCQDCKLPLDN